MQTGACDCVSVYGFSFGAGERFLFSPEPSFFSIPLVEVNKVITVLHYDPLYLYIYGLFGFLFSEVTILSACSNLVQ